MRSVGVDELQYFCIKDAITIRSDAKQNFHIMKKIGIYMFSAVLVFGSCTTSDQFGAAAGGGLLGGIFGSAIGGLLGGPRGADAGTVIGMITGAAMGAASASPEVTERGRSEYDYTSDNYNRRGRVAYSSRAEEADEIGREYANVEINNLRFIDENNNKAIDANENCKITFEVKNNSAGTIYNVAPVISVSGSKYIIISPTAVIGEILAGKSVRYSAKVYANRKLRNGMAEFTISLAKRNYQYTMNTFELETRAYTKPAKTSRAEIYR